jgi:hypothetical protein
MFFHMISTPNTINPEPRRSLPSTCTDALMPRRHECLRAAVAPRHNVDVPGCTNALKGRKPEKGHPEHRRSLPSMVPRHTVHPEHKKRVIKTRFL